ncbi:sugar phosphate isomerase/epimerase [Bacillus salipaludis]|uniref:Sugar phosphate isomerase/epimerase n=1 Tax=Bacillus salipaludis TaxID=2547811 RepID=A0A4R5VN98_9BACI|nr:sugar phosphate isomerase/epimerase [Bacillus salipaludis]MDQ6599184.1 sugar phosphate isomerase/epimerase [Bacillus salipaludis]TDK58831.1 sugar phosphate isomerase/epimerase [Bacillus salipaludis]
MENIIVPLNAFDSIEVLKKGQAAFIELIAKSGAFGVEIRRELFPGHDFQLEYIKNEIEKYQLFTVYSAPIELWKPDHSLNTEELMMVMEEGQALGANWIKVSLGHFEKFKSNIQELKRFLIPFLDIQFLVENDQTLYGGNVNRLKLFFESARQFHVPIKMTFDVGNWIYSNEEVESALRELAPFVLYIHLKQVENINGEFIPVPLETEGKLCWKKVMNQFPNNLVKALEFPIQPKEKTKEFVELVKNFTNERKKELCNS